MYRFMALKSLIGKNAFETISGFLAASSLNSSYSLDLNISVLER